MGKNTTNDMTQGNCMRLLVQFFLPILAGNLFQQLYSFADSMVVGKGIGDTALAAVGNTGSVHFLIIGFAIGLTGGLGICISQSFGSGNYEKLRKELAMSVWICHGKIIKNCNGGSRKNCSEILQCFRHQIFRCMEKCK